MEINSLPNGDLWFRFTDEEVEWSYVLIGVWIYNGVWFYREGDFYEKELRELE